jgi:hypothetical protein
MTPSKTTVQQAVSEMGLIGLENALSRLYQARSLVGSVPQGPATLRARVGVVLIRSVRRALFWLMPQLDGFHAAAIQCAEEQISTISQLMSREAALDEEICRLRLGAPAGTQASKTYDHRTDLSPELWLESIHQLAALGPPQPAASKNDTQQVQGSAPR